MAASKVYGWLVEMTGKDRKGNDYQATVETVAAHHQAAIKAAMDSRFNRYVLRNNGVTRWPPMVELTTKATRSDGDYIRARIEAHIIDNAPPTIYRPRGGWVAWGMRDAQGNHLNMHTYLIEGRYLRGDEGETKRVADAVMAALGPDYDAVRVRAGLYGDRGNILAVAGQAVNAEYEDRAEDYVEPLPPLRALPLTRPLQFTMGGRTVNAVVPADAMVPEPDMVEVEMDWDGGDDGGAPEMPTL